MKARCGTGQSNSGKPFTDKSVKDHERGCKSCIALINPDAPSLDYAKTSVINDGAYLEISRINPFI